MRRLGGLRCPLQILRQTLDPQCRRRISCGSGGHGADLGRYRPVRLDRGAGCSHGERPAGCIRYGDRDGWREPAGAIYRVPKRRVSRRSKPVVGDTRQRKGSRMMRKTFLVLVGATAGAALTLFATQSPMLGVGSSAKAAGADTYRQLSLFGDIFEGARAHYVEKPDDAKGGDW